VSRRRVAIALALLGLAWIATLAVSSEPAAGQPVLAATDDPTPTDSPSPTPTPTADPTPTPSCDGGLTFAPFASDIPGADTANQGATNGTSFTNTSGFTFTDTVMQVELIPTNKDVEHLPAVRWNLDEGPWQPIGSWTKLGGGGDPAFNSDFLPLGATIAPGSTHTLRFWMVWPPGSTFGYDQLIVAVELARCSPFGALGESAPVQFAFDSSVYVEPSAAKAGLAAQPAAPTPTARASIATATPTATAQPSALISQPLAADRPARDGQPWTVLAIGASLVLAALAAWMALGWWSAGRRLP
jgi:hypothetical protein